MKTLSWPQVNVNADQRQRRRTSIAIAHFYKIKKRAKNDNRQL